MKSIAILLIPVVFWSCNITTGSDNKKRFSGLIGGWYKSSNLTRLAESETLEGLHKVWDGASNHGGGWAGQWEGFITSPTSGKVTFHGSSSHNFIVKINGNQVLKITNGKPIDEAVVEMKKGEAYPVHIVYKQGGKFEVAEHEFPFFDVQWSWDGSEKVTVPQTAFHYNTEQNNTWSFIGENYMFPFNYGDEKDFPLDPIQIKAKELASLDFSQPTGGLPMVDGVETYTVCRANRENPEEAEGYGYTYQHHQDLAIWKGRMYVGWNTCEVDEDTWPNRELLSYSTDGKTWSKPVEMFPQGLSTPIRMYFFLAPNGRMLIIAGLRENKDFLKERNKSGIIVRELKADHTLSEVYTLRNIKAPVPNQPADYNTAKDKGFVEACEQLLDDPIYLAQQDYGNFLNPEDKMKWFNSKNWEGSEQLKDMANEFGKSMCFYTRDDGTIVSISKFRWVTTSKDGGKTWKQPVRPKSLITAWGKVWAQKTPDSKYVIIYNPHPVHRYPLVMLTSNDGITFSNPKSVNGPFSEKRYEGLFKDTGVSYHRGLTKWNNDGTWIDRDMWLVYSLHKEDILISKIPVPVQDKDN